MNRWKSRPYWLLLSAVALWVLLVLAPSWLHFAGWLNGEFAVRSMFKSVCHQIPERSFSLLGTPVAVCARCLGLYLGFLIGVIILPRADRLSGLLQARPRLMLLFLVPMACDLLIWENTHWSRFLTGQAAAFPVALFVYLAVEQIAASQLSRSSQ
jgi:uncharacterized membrane protein